MTGRERILAAFHGGRPDTVPFSPNIYQWFYHRQRTASLPAEIEGAAHPFDALRLLGADILARWDTQKATRARYTAGEFTERYGGTSGFETPVVTSFNVYPAGAGECRRRFTTPYGALTQTWTFMPEAGADFETEYWWKRWEEYEAVRFMLEATEYEFDLAEFQGWVKRAGEDGVVMVHLTQSPLKTFHWLAGPKNASLFCCDHRAGMKELAAIHQEKALALLERIVDLEEAEVFMSLDNLDTPFYAPDFYRDYCRSFFTRAADIIHRRGKIFAVHACGRNRKLLPLVGESSVDCLEGITPPPQGDVELWEARRLTGRESFTVNGGMDVERQEMGGDAEAALHHYTRRLFESMGDKRRFIFASSCSTSVAAPWRNLVYLRDAARECGRLD